MKRKTKAILAIIVLILILTAAYFISNMLLRNEASNTYISEQDNFKVNHDDVAIIYNYGLQKAYGKYREGEIYLPLNWVNAILNDKFYWSEGDDVLIYTLPDSVLYYNFDTNIGSDYHVILKEDEKLYLSLELIKMYTDIYVEDFIDVVAKRIYINDIYGSYQVAKVKKNTHLRSKATKKSDIVLDMEKFEEVRIIPDDTIASEKSKKNDWLKVYTSTGYTGYLMKRQLKDFVNKEIKSEFIKPEYSVIHMDEPVILGWHQVTAYEANKNLGQIINNEYMNVISPTWFSLTDNEGNYSSFASAEYVNEAHKRNIQVWGLIDNFNKDVRTEVLLSKTSARKKLIESLINDAKIYNLDGINVDFESLKKAGIKHYIQFIRELSVACRNNSLILSVDNPSYASYNVYYERGKQAEVVDYIINMGYDEHYAGSEKGSVASYNFVKYGIEGSLEEIPKEKLINAIPLYTRIWTEGASGKSSKAVGINMAKKWVEENSVSLSWDDELKQFYGEHTDIASKSYIWMEDEESIKNKMDLIKEYDLAGVACWKLGLEPPQIWDIVGTIDKK